MLRNEANDGLGEMDVEVVANDIPPCVGGGAAQQGVEKTSKVLLGPGVADHPATLPIVTSIRHATAPPIRLLFCCRKAASLILPSHLHARRSRNFRSAVLVGSLSDAALQE